MNWHYIYNHLTRLLILYYEKNRSDTGKNLYNIFINNPKFIDLNRWIHNFQNWNVQSLDPIHIFASFNYYDISTETRLEKLFFYINILEKELKEKITDLSEYKNIKLEGIPSVNLARIMSARNEKSQSDIWEFFYSAMTNDVNKLDDFFNLVNHWYGIQVPSLTIFLFWANSDKYFPLDKHTVKLMKYNKMIIPTNIKDYKNTLINNQDDGIYREIVEVAYEKF